MVVSSFPFVKLEILNEFSKISTFYIESREVLYW